MIVSPPRDLHISITPDIKDYIMKCLHLLFSKEQNKNSKIFILNMN